MELHVENKVVPIVSNPDLGDACHVLLLDLYLSKLPAKAREADIFYLQPLTQLPSDPRSHGMQFLLVEKTSWDLW